MSIMLFFGESEYVIFHESVAIELQVLMNSKSPEI